MKKWAIIALVALFCIATFELVVLNSKRSIAEKSTHAYAAPTAEAVGSTSETARTVTVEKRNGVKELRIDDTNPSELDHLGDYVSVESLTINCLDYLKELPGAIGDLPNLKELRIGGGNACSMSAMAPASLGKLKHLQKLTLVLDFDTREVPPGTKPSATDQSRWLRKFPASLAELKTLEELEIGSEFTKVPDFVKDLSNLKTLKMSYNNLSDLPDFLNDLPHLKEVSLQDNCLILNDRKKQRNFRRRFPRIQFDFSEDEPVCEGDNP